MQGINAEPLTKSEIHDAKIDINYEFRKFFIFFNGKLNFIPTLLSQTYTPRCMPLLSSPLSTL